MVNHYAQGWENYVHVRNLQLNIYDAHEMYVHVT